MDSDLARTAFYDAISDFISADDDFTWSTISDPDIAIILESFISECIFQRAYIDLHVNIRNGCTSIAQEASRISEVRDFIKAEAGAVFREHWSSTRQINTAAIQGLTREVIRATANVFEEYL